MKLLKWWVAMGLMCVPVCGAVVIQSASPNPVPVEAGGGQSWLIVRGTGLEAVREIRSLINGRVTDHVMGRPAPVQDGMREFVMLARPDAPRGEIQLVGVEGGGARWDLPVRAVVVEPGDPRAAAAGKAADLSQAARQGRGAPIIVDREQVPTVLATRPQPLMVEPNGRTATLVLQGRNLERVNDVRIRREGEAPRYRGKQGRLPFRSGNGALEVDVVAAPGTAMGTRYVLDLLVEQYLAASVPLVVGVPPPPAPQVETRETSAPRVIELPPPPPVAP